MMDVFVSMPFEDTFYDVFQSIKQAINEQGLKEYRVDQDYLTESIAITIKGKIRESRIIIADITGNNPNVLHEVGQAQTLGKPLVFISQNDPREAPFNVRGEQIHQYDIKNLANLTKTLKAALSKATSPNEMLRAMLVPSSLGHLTNSSRFVIAASPLSWRRAMGRAGGYKKLRRTSSDYVGMRGILQAFGLLYGFETLPDIVDPEDCDDKVITEPMHLYCLASPKANRWTNKLLEQYQQRWVPRLEFKADPSSKNLKNIRVSLFYDGRLEHPDGWEVNVDGDRYKRDFGLIVRGPNPYHENKMVAIMAGRSSLGTEASCRAFTDTKLIMEIQQRLSGLNIDLENHRQAFWVIVSMDRAEGDEKEEAIINSLCVEKVGVFRLL